MTLEQELKLPRPMDSINHETLLSIVRTNALIMKYADRFFSPYGVTDVQFNILMILHSYAFEDGMNQQELSQKLVVSKSNMVGLVDRLERNQYVVRKSKEGDRRSNQVFLTAKGKKLVEKIHDLYFKKVDNLINSLSAQEKKIIITGTEKIRQFLRKRSGE